MKKLLLIVSILFAALGLHLVTIPKQAEAELKVEGDASAIRSLVVEGYSQSPSRVVLQGSPEEIRGLFDLQPSFGSGMSQPIVGAGVFTAATTTSLVVGSGNPTGNFGSGDTWMGGDATTTGSMYVTGELTVSGNLNTGPLTFADNSGAVTWFNMGVTSAASVGTVESYTAKLDGTNLLTIYSESDGAGGIQNAGVGVNTTTPEATLAVEMDTRNPSFVVANTASTTPSLVVEGVNQNGYVGIRTFNPTVELDVNGRLNVTSTTTLDTTMLVVNPNENRVGINTANPQEVLQVGNALALNDGGNKVYGIGYSPNSSKSLISGYPAEIRLAPTTGLLSIGVEDTTRSAGDTISMNTQLQISGPLNRATTTGSLIVGTTNPAGPNMTAGETLFGGNSTTTGASIHFSGLSTSITGNGLCIATDGQVTNAGAAACIPSNPEIKHSIKDSDPQEALKRVMAVKPKEFIYNEGIKDDGYYPALNENGERMRFGFNAWELQDIDPRLADGYTREDGKSTSVDFIAQIHDLYAVVQLQQKEIESLKESKSLWEKVKTLFQ